MNNNSVSYHYIIAGAGASGLSLVVRMIDAGIHLHKKILIIDKDEKQQNDRTWCFWEKETSRFESIIHKSWKNIDFYAHEELSKLDIAPYTYKMIRGIDFYNYCKNIIAKTPEVHWVKEEIVETKTIADKTQVKTSTQTYIADFTFSSLFSRENLVLKPKEFMLLQHFKGYIIKTKTPRFDVNTATFMDFRVRQTHGTTFVYVLPFSETEALVEYTLFTESLLKDEEYDAALLDYIEHYLNIKDYEILDREFGIIPMTDHVFPAREGRVINIGTAGGFTKASTGFTFKNIQNNTEKMVEGLLKGHLPTDIILKSHWRFQKYDATLLNVLVNKRMRGKDIFEKMFAKLPASLILSFLDNTTTLSQELKIMSSLPTPVFLPAAMKEMGKMF